MSSEAQLEHMDNMSRFYYSERFPGVCIRSAEPADDSQLVALYAEQIRWNYLQLSMQRQPSYLAVSHLQYNRSETKVIVLEKHPEQVLGMLNIGWKYCYINEKPDVIRYISDLKIHPNYRGKHLFAFLIEYLKETLATDSMVQTVVLSRYHKLQHILYEPRLNFPAAFPYDIVDIYSISQIPQQKNFEQYHFEVLSKAQIPDLHKFRDRLKAEFNFLPTYDFNVLLEGNSAFWKNMHARDFYVVYNSVNQIVGFYGLWDQQAFKQMYISSSHQFYRYIRPFYNMLAMLKGHMTLPALNQPLNYMMLDSALCAVQDIEVYGCMLYHALHQARLRKKNAISLALANDDPRAKVLKRGRYLHIQAQHSLHSFQTNPETLLDGSKMSYFELSRL